MTGSSADNNIALKTEGKKQSYYNSGYSYLNRNPFKQIIMRIYNSSTNRLRIFFVSLRLRGFPFTFLFPDSSATSSFRIIRILPLASVSPVGTHPPSSPPGGSASLSGLSEVLLRTCRLAEKTLPIWGGRRGGRCHCHTAAVHIDLHPAFLCGTLWLSFISVCRTRRCCFLLLLHSSSPHIHGWRRSVFRYLFGNLFGLLAISPSRAFTRWSLAFLA